MPLLQRAGARRGAETERLSRRHQSGSQGIGPRRPTRADDCRGRRAVQRARTARAAGEAGPPCASSCGRGTSRRSEQLQRDRRNRGPRPGTA
jgi:hypothetical protein